MRRFVSLSLLFAACVVAPAVLADQSLDQIEVNADTLDHGSVEIPYFVMPYFKGLLGPSFSSINDVAINETKDAVCSDLNKHKPAGCSINNYLPAPGIPSPSGAKWGADGCGESDMLDGAAIFNLALASGLRATFSNAYSGDLNAPDGYQRGVVFTTLCNEHDQNYSSAVTKAFADNIFARHATQYCGGISDQAAQGACNMASAAYQTAFVRDKGDTYDARQAKTQCAAWAHAMKENQCKSS